MDEFSFALGGWKSESDLINEYGESLKNGHFFFPILKKFHLQSKKISTYGSISTYASASDQIPSVLHWLYQRWFWSIAGAVTEFIGNDFMVGHMEK